MKKRLLLYTNSRLTGFLGGMERHMELIARLIDREKFEVYGMTPDLPTLTPLLEWLAPHCRDVAAVTFDKDHLRNIVPFARQIRRWKIDVAHLHNGHYSGYLSSVLGVRLGGVRKIYLTEHTPPEADAVRFARSRAILFRAIDGMVCVSQKNFEARSRVFYTPPERTFVIENGVDTDEFTPIPGEKLQALRERHGLPVDAEIVGTLVRLEEGKGLQYLVDAFPAIRAARPRAHLLIVGDGVLREELESQAARLGVKDWVRFAGYQTESKAYLGLMDAFVLPVPYGSMSIALLEAMAMRRAVVITFGGEGEAVVHEKTGLLAEPRNPASIASEILKILGSTEKRDALGNGARRHVEEHFSAKVTARRLEELYLRS
jgi:glycosyltransferase involved in cell wall biosynthesis